jgi:hypothetical protein
MRLDFRIEMYDDMMRADVEEGNYEIHGGFYPGSDSDPFSISAFLNGEVIQVGNFLNLYDALEGANDHYEEYTR